MHYIPFNPFLDFHKMPFGAIKDSQQVVFRVILPRELECTGMRLVVNEDSGECEKFIMSWDCMEGSDEEWWKVIFAPSKKGLFWYHFEYDCINGTRIIKKGNDGFASLHDEGGEKWQLTVYDKDFTTPDHIKGGVIYQIFPDRFYFSGERKDNVPSDRIIRNDFSGEPMWNPDRGGKIKGYDFFCGDFKGITEKLDYLESLSVSCIYLNPVFEAHSNHRYDIADYTKTNPLLGTEKDLEELCLQAEKRGISVILDGVFSHTGADSVYFNSCGRYDSVGAYQSKDSPYYGWYKFSSWPNNYDSWWGIDILPEVEEENESYLDFITGENGIARHWLRAGVSGWRLDVADELPDRFLDEFRKAVKTEKEDAYILGEVWEDASNKISYGKRRRYLLGEQLDSVMNYPFARAIIDFLKSRNAENFINVIMQVLEHYPKPAADTLMNHIGTHDTVRAVNLLVGVEPDSGERRSRKMSDGEKRKGIRLMKLASAIQFTLPGVPCVYYGDEAGLEGGADPFNRACFPWGRECEELVEWYRRLGKLRKKYNVFKEGNFRCVSASLGCVAYERYDSESAVMTVANANEHEIVYRLPEDWNSYCILAGAEQSADNGIVVTKCSAAILQRKI